MKIPRKPLIFAVLLAVLGIAVYLAVFQSDLEAIETARTERSMLLERHRAAAGLAVNLELHKQQMRELDEMFGLLLDFLPNDAGVTWSPERRKEVEDTLGAAAAAAGIGAPAISVGPPQYDENDAWRRLEIIASGEYPRVADFLQRVSTASSRNWTVHYASVKPDASGTGVRLIAEIHAYGMVDAELRAEIKKGKR